MKNKIYATVLIVLFAIGLSSCYSSRKQGCPANVQGNYKFRG